MNSYRILVTVLLGCVVGMGGCGENAGTGGVADSGGTGDMADSGGPADAGAGSGPVFCSAKTEELKGGSGDQTCGVARCECPDGEGDRCLSTDCDDANECSEDFCTSGLCEVTLLDDGTLCNDGADECKAGRCRIPGWDTAEPIETGNAPAGAPQVAMDGNGNAVAVWVQNNNIASNRYTQGDGWGTAELIETGQGRAFAPQVAMDGSGNAVAVWTQVDTPAGDAVVSNRYDAQSDSWGTWERIETGNALARAPQVAMDGNGNAVAVWVQNNNIASNRYTQGDGWGTAELIETGQGRAFAPQVAMDGSGNAVAVWTQVDTPFQDTIVSNRYDAQSDSWGTWERIETGQGRAFAPQVAMDPSGNAVAVWTQVDTPAGDAVVSNRYDAQSGSWGTWERIETGQGRAFAPQVAMDGSGNAVAVWTQVDTPAGDAVVSNRYDAQSDSWGTWERIETGNALARAPQVAMDGNGNAVAVWWQNNNIASNRYTPSGGWGTAELAESSGFQAGDEPQVAMDGSGSAVAVWMQWDGVATSIMSNRFGDVRKWGVEKPIETGGGEASTPQVGMDGSGNALAVWTQSSRIWSNRYKPSDRWGTADLIEGLSTSAAAFLPQVAVDPSGNAVAVWVQSDGAADSIVSNRYAQGDGWGTAELIETGQGRAFAPQVAMDPSGNAVAVWTQVDTPFQDTIVSNRYDAQSGSWGTWELIETGQGRAFAPQVAMDGSGNAVAVWTQVDTPAGDAVVSNRYDAQSDSWGTWERIETGNALARAPQVAMDGNGNAVAVWVQNNNIASNRYTQGDGWGTAELIETGQGRAFAPQVAMDGSGNAVAVWTQVDTPFQDTIVSNRYDAQSDSWGTWERIETGQGRAFAPQVAMDPSGNAVAVWTQVDTPAGDAVVSNRYDAQSGMWGTWERIETGNALATAPQVAMDGNGNAVAVWEQQASIWSNRLE